MIRILCCILLAFAGTFLSRAQSIEQLDEKIVQIQRDAAYINGSDFRTDELSARKRAFNELADQVNARRVDVGKPVIRPRQLMEYVDEITYEDDGYYRVVFYVSVAEVMSLREGDHPAVPRKILRHASGEAPDIFEGMQEEQSPVRPKPQAEPAKEPEKAPDTEPVAPAAQPVPVTPSPARPQPDNRPRHNPLPPGNVGSDYVAKTLVGIDTYEEAALYIKKYKDEGYVTAYAFARNRNEIQPDMYLLVVDGDKRVAAVFMPQQGTLRRNLLSGRDEDIDAYLGNHYILWFRCR